MTVTMSSRSSLCRVCIATEVWLGACCFTTASEHAGIGKPALHTRGTLQGLGINGQHPSISASVYVTSEESKVIAKAIVGLSRRITGKNAEKFIRRKLDLVDVDLKLNGKCDWVSTEGAPPPGFKASGSMPQL